MFRNITPLLFVLGLFALVACGEESTPDSQNLIDDQIIEDFILANDLSYEETATGLRYNIIEPGGTGKVQPADTVSLHYRGTLLNGTEFDSSRRIDDEPIESGASGFIPGFNEGLTLIGATGKIDILIPSRLGYGSSPRGLIPANSVIRFEIEVVDIQ